MSTVVCFLGSVLSDGGWTATAASDIPTALGDFTDSSYAAPPTSGDMAGTMYLRFDAPTIPAYARVRSLTVKGRVSGDGTAQMSAGIYTTGVAPGVLAWADKPPVSAASRIYAPMPLAPGGRAWSSSTIGAAQLQVWAQSPVHILGLWAEADVDEAPTVTILSPTGTLSGDSRPTIRWSMFDPEGQGQERAQVRLFTQSAYAAPNFNPETAVAVRSWDIVGTGSELALEVPPDAYALHIRASEAGSYSRYGPWAVGLFALTGATPGTPALTVDADVAAQRARLTVTRADNLLGYEQAGGGDSSSPVGWYADTNATAPTSAAAVAAGTEGPRVVAMQSVASGAVSMRAGGPLLTAGIPSPAPGGGGSPGTVTVDAAHMPTRVSTAYLAGGDVTTVPFFAAAGTVLVALAGFTSWPGGGSVVPSVRDSSGLTWTQQALDPSGARQDQSGVWTAVVPSDRTLTVTAGAVHNVSMKSLQVVPCLGADPSSPVGSAGIGSSTGAPTASATASLGGAIMLAHFTNYWDGPLPTWSPGTEISSVKVGTTFAAGQSAPASSAGASLNVGITSPSSGVSWTYAYVILNPAPVASPPVSPPVPPTSSVASPWLAGVPVKAGKNYIGIGQGWQAAGAVRHCRLDVRLYDELAQLRSTVAGTSAATAVSAMTSLPDTAFTPDVDGIAVLIAVAEDAAAGGETFHFDRLGVGPAGWRWSRGGVVAQNLLGWADSSLIGSPTWGALACTRTVISESTLSGQALQLTSAAAGGGQAGPTPVPIPSGVSVLSAACIVKVSDSNVGPCWVSMRWIGVDGGTLGWPGGVPVNPKTGGAWTLLKLENAPVPPGAAQVQITVAGSGALGGGQYSRWAHFGIWAASTVPVAWNTGPGVESYPLLESSDDGESWEYVRGTDKARFTDGEVGVVYDYEICPGLTRHYRASTAAVDYRADAAGVLLVSSPSVPLDAWLPTGGWWLKDPNRPGVSLELQVAGDLPFQISARAALFDVLDDPGSTGPQLPKAVFGRRSGQDHSLSLIVRGEDDWRALLAMLTPGGPLLLVGDMGEQWWVLPGDAKTVLKSSTSRLLDPTRPVDLALTQIARPSQAARSV